MKQRDLVIRSVAGFRGHELEDGYALQRPSVARSNEAQLRFAFGKGDVKHPLSSLHAIEEELKRERGLARAWGAFDEIQAVWIEATAQNIIQARHTG